MSTTNKKLFLLDGMALIFRSYYAFIKNPRINSKGLNTSAMLGFTNTLLDVLTKEKPTHIAIGFDTPEPTFRHEFYKQYKAQRESPPEDLVLSIPYIEKIAQAFKIPVLKMPGFEADDVIGTLAKKAEKEGFNVYMMTSDKDYAQLVTDKIKIYKPSYMGTAAHVLGINDVLEKWNIKSTEQVIDILALQGDAVDNIPGVPGVGEKTAQKLISEFGSVENLLQNVEKVEGKLQNKISDNKDLAIISKKLAVIKTDVEVEFNENEFLLENPDYELLIPLFNELEFKTILNKLLNGKQDNSTVVNQTQQTGQFSLFDSANATTNEVINTQNEQIQFKTIHDVAHNYVLCSTPKQRKLLIDLLKQQSEICFDTETTSVDAFEAEIIGLSFCFKQNEAYYIPLSGDQNSKKTILKEFESIFTSSTILKIGQNLKYDLHILLNYDVEVKGNMFDTMIAHYLIASEEKHGMDYMAKKFLNYEPISIETLIGKKGINQDSMANVPVEKVYEYACEDADVTFQLKNILEKKLVDDGLLTLFNNIEIPLISTLLHIERNGVAIDTTFLRNYSEELLTYSKQVEQSIYNLSGEHFNIASPKQLGDVLFDKLKLDAKAKKTKTGQYATGEDVLQSLSDKHEIVNQILDFRELNKLKSTYVDSLPNLISKKDGLIHTSFNQTITSTGRLSSINPNLQNIPIRTDRGKKIRNAFVPRSENFMLLSADYSQIELRFMAHFSKDETMIQAFKNNEDIHKSTAAKVFHVQNDEVTSDMRRKAKMVNFGIIYGISAFGLAQRLSIPRTEASEIINTYFEKFSSVKAFMDKSIEIAQKNGYAETIMGRRRYLPDINSRNHTVRSFAERNAINAPIQGSAADLIKLAMIEIHSWMQKEKLKSKLILQVHDELVFDVLNEEKECITDKVKNIMEHALELDIPLKVDIGFGKNWLDAH